MFVFHAGVEFREGARPEASGFRFVLLAGVDGALDPKFGVVCAKCKRTRHSNRQSLMRLSHHTNSLTNRSSEREEAVHGSLGCLSSPAASSRR